MEATPESEPTPPSAPSAAAQPSPARRSSAAGDKVRIRRENIQAVLDQCQRTLELLKNANLVVDQADGAAAEEGEEGERVSVESPSASDCETDEICKLLKSKVESPDFFEKLGNIHMSAPHNISGDDCPSWHVISAKDLWEDKDIGMENESDQDDYVIVNQEDIVEGIACFMAAYLLSLKETQELTPNQLQDALSKTFSMKKKQSKLHKAWDGSKVIYNVVSWGATAVGIYQNPAIFKAASLAFWSSCRVVSKLF